LYPVSRKDAGYDRVATMFSPDGRLYQVEYASKIVEQGTLGLGIVFDGGVLFGADKHPSSKLMMAESIEKVFKIDEHIGAISAGLVGDARRIIQIARKDAQDNKMHYEEAIPVSVLVKNIASIMQVFTQYGGMRPFGVSLVIGGWDPSGYRLFETEPSGALAEYKAVAIGKGKKEAMKLFEQKFKDNLSLDQAIVLLTEGLEKGLGEKQKLDLARADFAVIRKDTGFERLTKQRIKAAFSNKK
jgi:proteasome alpha subunit